MNPRKGKNFEGLNHFIPGFDILFIKTHDMNPPKLEGVKFWNAETILFQDQNSIP